MYEPATMRKPASVSVVGAISLIWSVTSILGFALIVLAAVGISTLSWLGGPVVGAVGMAVGLLVVIVAGLKSLLNLLLLGAAWRTIQGEPAGRSLHVAWAWCTLVIDALDLLLTGGMDPTAWWGLGYAIYILYLMDRPEVRAYFGRRDDYAYMVGRGMKPPILDDF